MAVLKRSNGRSVTPIRDRLSLPEPYAGFWLTLRTIRVRHLKALNSKDENTQLEAMGAVVASWNLADDETGEELAQPPDGFDDLTLEQLNAVAQAIQHYAETLADVPKT
jgi:hypothetical protein